MKTLRKLSSLMLSLLLVIAMAIPVFAVDIRINDAGTDSKFEAYKLLDAAYATTGDGVSYKVNATFREALKAVTKKTEDKEIIKYIQDLSGGDKNSAGVGTEIRAFADAMYSKIKELNISADYTTTTQEFASVEKGYYMIVETVPGSDKIQSLAMLGTAGKGKLFEIKAKNNGSTIPQIEKKVKDKNDSTGDVSDWQDAADYDVNDRVPFKLEIDLPKSIDGFKYYEFRIEDTFSDGLTFNEADFDKVFDETRQEGFSMEVGGTTVKTSFKIKKVGQKIVIYPKEGNLVQTYKNNNILKQAATDETKLVVRYFATLNQNALMGTAGNPNTAKIRFSSDPNWDGNGAPAPGEDPNPGNPPLQETPEDKVVVFTYKFVVDKHGPGGKGGAGSSNDYLLGAEFKLFKKDLSYNGNDDETSGALGETNWREVPFTKQTNGYTFIAERIDAGEYRLVETKAPDGYNAIEPFNFTISAQYDKDSKDPKLTALTGAYKGSTGGTNFSPELAQGKLCIRVINQQGVELPETGGMGTTMLYLSGAILSLGAGIVLVSRKRMKIEK